MNESDLCDAALAELLTLTVEVDHCGDTRYRNHLGQRHRIHGPAVVWADGEKWWLQNDLLHRTDGPAVETDGYKHWYLNGERFTEAQWNERIKSM